MRKPADPGAEKRSFSAGRREGKASTGRRTARVQKGRVGCGCLLFILVVCIILAGVLIHPFSLKLIANRFHYGDTIAPCDTIFVPRFPEDGNGEIYAQAFREFWAGDGKSIWVEEDHVFGFTMKDIVTRMARERGIKEDVVRGLRLEGDDLAKATQVKETLRKHGVRKVVVVVPEYASRRFHAMYGADESGAASGPLCLIKPVDVSYFDASRWWRSEASRSAMLKEFYRFGLFYLDRFKYGARGGSGKDNGSTTNRLRVFDWTRAIHG